jgi:hypothetical protein
MAGIGEEQLHIPCARFLAVDAINRPLFALDPPRYLQLIGIVEGGGRGTVGILDEETDFRRVAGRALA